MKDFCKQEAPTYIFRGSQKADSVSLSKLFFEYPLEKIVSDPEFFYASLKSIYLQEKILNPLDGDVRVVDLNIMKDVTYLDFHLKVHAITGLPELGTSNTENIPYWDRQAVHVALKHHFGEKAKYFTQESDIEIVNVLRSFLHILAPKFAYAIQAKNNLEELLQRKKNFTRSDISPLLKEQYEAWNIICNNYHRVFIAKIKHLVFCADKIENWDIRHVVLKEIQKLITQVNVSEGDLVINLGVDGGVTKDTYRPAYQIHMFPQLKHLGVKEVSVSEDQIVQWSFEVQKQSLNRQSEEKTLLKELDSYLLDWKL